MHRVIAPDAQQAADACAAYIAAKLRDALNSADTASLAISGGSSPKPMFARLAAAPLDWNRIHLFWVDERCVPPDHPQSNYGMTLPHLIQPAAIPAANLHRIHGELDPAEAAARYIADIQSHFRLAPGEMPAFDVIHNGIGPDGHTASLFPGSPLLDDTEHIAASIYVEKMQQSRVTLLPAALLAARNIVIFSPGSDKAATIKAVLANPYDPKKLPAQLLVHHNGSVAWFHESTP